MRSGLARAAQAAALAFTLAFASGARAEDPAAAQALFGDAKKLMSAGKYAEACPKLEESERLAPATGTKFNLADCYEHTGKMASAWAAFLSVAASAKNANQGAREKAARDRAAALEPKLSRLAVVVPEATRAPGLEVKRDDHVVGAAEWAEAMPVDPGEHALSAAAPGKRGWRAIVEVAGNGGMAKVIVPPLDDEPAPAAVPIAAPTPTSPAPLASAPPTDTAPSTSGSSSSSTLGWALVGVGGAAVIGGAVVWAMRGSVQSRLDAECGPDQKQCPASATDDIANGKTYTALGVGLFALGGIGLGAGAIVLLTGGKQGASARLVRLVPIAGPNATGLRLVGTF